MAKKAFDCLECGTRNEFGRLWCKKCYEHYEYKASFKSWAIGAISGLIIFIIYYKVTHPFTGPLEENEETIFKLIGYASAFVGAVVISQFTSKHPYLKTTDTMAKVYQLDEDYQTGYEGSNKAEVFADHNRAPTGVFAEVSNSSSTGFGDFPPGKMSLDNAQYRLWLVKHYGIERNDILNEVVCGEKSFETADDALRYAHSVQTSLMASARLNESELQKADASSIDDRNSDYQEGLGHSDGEPSNITFDPEVLDEDDQAKAQNATFKGIIWLSVLILVAALGFISWDSRKLADQVSVTVERDANLRDRPDTSNSIVIDKVPAGTLLTGRWTEGTTPQSGRWLEIVRAGKKLYLWEGNLTPSKAPMVPKVVSPDIEFNNLNEDAIRAGRQCYVDNDPAACPQFERLFEEVEAGKSSTRNFCMLEVTASVSYSVPCQYKDKYWYVFSGGTFGDPS